MLRGKKGDEKRKIPAERRWISHNWRSNENRPGENERTKERWWIKIIPISMVSKKNNNS